MGRDELARSVETVRGFNRFYTQRIGVLHEGLLGSPYPLTEARVIYELGRLDSAIPAELGRSLDLDPGYLSRILKRFRDRGLVKRGSVPGDRRRVAVALTAKGRRVFASLDAGSRREIGAVLRKMEPGERARLLGGIDAVGRALGAPPGAGRSGAADAPAPVLLRAHRPGDLGWVIGRHGALYAQDYGWDASFEAFVAEIAARFIRDFDPRRERSWIAERDGEIVGCCFLVRQSARVAKLRMLLVDPAARGLGLGERLVGECIAAARELGYRSLVLWTNDVLHAARRIYERAGFRCVRRERHVSFGKRLVGEYWELDLRAPAR